MIKVCVHVKIRASLVHAIIKVQQTEGQPCAFAPMCAPYTLRAHLVLQSLYTHLVSAYMLLRSITPLTCLDTICA